MDFDDWLRRVNEALELLVGLGVDEIEDMPWYRWFSEHTTAKQAAKAAVYYMNQGYCPDFASANVGD